jgi:hypothetical protein
MRANRLLHLRATPTLMAWAAEEGDVGAPDTTFKNIKPGLLLRYWRQLRHRLWIAYNVDENFDSPVMEPFAAMQRLEQVSFSPTSTYGVVPGSYCDPLMYNTKTTSPYRWHMANNSSDVVGHWYADTEDIERLKEWKPKTDDPMEMVPKPPQVTLKWDETIDDQGNRTFRYKYKYDCMGPFGLGEAVPKYPWAHLYMGHGPFNGGMTVESYGFKQGHLLRCDEEEESILRRVMHEEDKEWEMIKRTEIIQEPFSYPGQMRTVDFLGAVERAKARFREQIKQGKPTDPSEDPEYDLVKNSEYCEPRDGPRAMWRHLWTSNKDRIEYQVTFNDGYTLEDNENKPPAHPRSKYEKTPKEAPWKKFEQPHDDGHQATPAQDVSKEGSSPSDGGEQKH